MWISSPDDLRVAPCAWDNLRRGQLVWVRADGERTAAAWVWRRRQDRIDLRWLDGEPRHVWRDALLGRVTALRLGPLWIHPFWLLAPFWAAQLWAAWKRRRRPAPRAPRRDGPEGVHLNVSSACNLACRMCPYLPVHRNPRQLPWADFERLLPQLRELSVVHVTGAGEPTTHPRLAEMITAMRASYPGLRLELTTNGTLLTGARLDALLRSGLDRITVSLDGARDETTAAIRIHADGARLRQNLAELTRRKRELGLTTPVLRLNCMAGFGVYAELVEYVRMAHALGAQEIRLLELQYPGAEDRDNGLLAGLASDGGKQLREAFALASHLGIQLLLPLEQEGRCTLPEVPHLSEEGQVFPCCFLAHGRTLHSQGQDWKFPSLPMGDLHNQTLEESWRSPAYQKLLEETREGRFSPVCRACMEARLPTGRKLLEVLEIDR